VALLRVVGVLGSLLLPGVGVGLVGRLARAATWAALAALLTGLIVTSVWWLPVALLVRVASALDAWRLMRATPPRQLEAAFAAGMLGVVGWLFAGWALDAFRIPSESMVPTIEIGDHVYVDALHRSPMRGEVIFFDHPCSHVVFVKRVVGVPGDRIELRCGVLWRNGSVVDVLGGRGDFPDRAKPFAPRCGPDSSQPEGRLVETSREVGCARQLEYVVPDGGVFVMGDNRGNANDSRFWGIVPMAAIRGRAIGVYWPPARFGPIE